MPKSPKTKTRTLWYYWWQHGSGHTYQSESEEKRQEAASRRQAIKEGRWVGPLRSSTIIEDLPA